MTELQNTAEIVSKTETSVPPARVFVALRIAPEIAQELSRYGKGLEQFSVGLVPPADIHLTLVPPWNEVSIADAVAKLRRVAETCVAFTLEFHHIGYGPSKDVRVFCGRSASLAMRSQSSVQSCSGPLGKQMNGRFVRM